MHFASGTHSQLHVSAFFMSICMQSCIKHYCSVHVHHCLNFWYMHFLVFTASNPLRSNISTSYQINRLKSPQEILHANQMKNSNTCNFISIRFQYCLLALRICYVHTFVSNIQNIFQANKFLIWILEILFLKLPTRTWLCQAIFSCRKYWSLSGSWFSEENQKPDMQYDIHWLL